MNKLRRWWNTADFKALKIFACFCLLVYGGRAQTIIEGEIDYSLGVDSFKFTYTTNVVEHENIFARGREKNVHVRDGRFSITLNESPDVFYVMFNLPRNRSASIGDDYRVFGNRANVFMIEPGCRTEVRILPNEVLFSGRQTYLMRCQLDLFALFSELNKRKIKLVNEQDFLTDVQLEATVKEYFSKYRALHDSIISVSKRILSRYASNLDDSISNAIYYNFIGQVKFFEINDLNFRVTGSKDTLRSYFIEYYNQKYLHGEDAEEIQGYFGKSNMYPKYLAYKASTDIAMRLAVLGRNMKPNAALVDNLISESYSGWLYDQVAFASLLNRGTTQYIDDMFFNSLMGNIKNREYLGHIEEIRNRRSTRERSYQFELEDEHGKIYTNADFKDKVILLDFWFTGCKGCLALHKNMKPVKEYFKNNEKFVYVSISIDKKKQMWEKSLESGKYTDITDIKLWLGELGDKHPMIGYYNIASYPTMIIVNGDDEVVAMNPPNPYNEHNKNTLINMIDEALKK